MAAHPLPHVAAHPEAVSTLVDLGADRIGVDEAYERLRAIVATYLPPDSGDRRAKIVGVLIRLATVPWGSSPEVLDALAREWEQSGNDPPSALAVERAVWQLNCALLLALPTEEDLLEGHDRLFDERLARFFPPEGFPSFRE
jgi:hypothetical protein